MADESLSLPVHEPYVEAGQQREADQLGMWLFLASEVMLFGAVFLSVAVYRLLYPQGVAAAAAHLDRPTGAVETAVLLTSSLTMALAVRAARLGRRGETLAELGLTLVLGLGFEAIKLLSWRSEIAEGLLPGHGRAFPVARTGGRMFFHLYFVATGLHALHLAVGIGVLTVLAGRLLLRRLPLPERAAAGELAGLYWHLIDIVWVFLYPVFYLVPR